MATASTDACAATVRAVCVPYSEIPSAKVDCICEFITNTNITDAQIERIREIIRDRNAALEPPMPVREAARLLGISTTALHYHIRRGHIRRCVVAGAARGRGVVAADVRAILKGEAV